MKPRLQYDVSTPYMAKNFTGMLQFVNFTGLLQQTCQFRQVAKSLLKSACINWSFADLLEFVETTCKGHWQRKFLKAC